MRAEVIVVTLANAARLDHVRRQADLIPAGVEHIVVALGDAELLRSALPGSEIIDAGAANLATARNRGGDEAVRRGADVIVFLDADCLPDDRLLVSYAETALQHPETVLAGPVTYLPEGEIRTNNPQPHPARPSPQPGEILKAQRYELFWSLSFAVTAGTWEKIRATFGGFDEGYEGYGGEDTDFGQHLKQAGIDLLWVGGAHAYHQWHPVSDPPVEHLHDIVANATRFHDIWGWWPMGGWLDKFEAAGLVIFEDGRWKETGEG